MTAPSQPPQRPPDRPSRRGLRSWPIWVPVIVSAALYLLGFSIVSLLSRGQQVQLSFTQFEAQVAAGNVQQVRVQGDTIDGQARTPVPDHDQPSRRSATFETHVPGFAGQDVERLLEQHHVDVVVQSSSPGGPFWSLLLAFGPVLLLMAAFLFLARRFAGAAGQGGGMFGFGRSRARLYDVSQPATTFDDVAGIDEVEAELEEVVDFLREPERYARLGATVPKGVLLVGEPGTGKTLLARAVAGEAGVPFLSVNASEFVEMIVGVGASRVRDLFLRAKESAPAIVFIDEIDAVGRRRGGPMPLGGHNEQEQTLNQILAEMDGFDPRQGVIVIAATNRADVLDQALLRPGRFDRQVVINPPDRRGRRRILDIHVRHVPLGPDVDLDRVAAGTPGLVGADLRNLVNEAALLAARRGRDHVAEKDLDDALTKVVLGAERHLAMTEQERERIAYHESGHALVALLLPGADSVRSVSIVPRGRSLGATIQRPADERFNLPEEDVRARITGALGGRAAERVVYGSVSTGAEDDLRALSDLARSMVVRWGMSPRLGPIDYREPEDGRWSPASVRSPETAGVIDREVRRIVDECFERACSLLERNRERLDALARALLADETLDEDAIRGVAGLDQAQAPESGS